MIAKWRQIFAEKGRMDKLVTQYSGFALPTYYIIDRAEKIRYNFHSRKAGVKLEDVITALMQK